MAPENCQAQGLRATLCGNRRVRAQQPKILASSSPDVLVPRGTVEQGPIHGMSGPMSPKGRKERKIKMKKGEKVKPVYLRIRLPIIRQTGGAHAAGKGGGYRRTKEKNKSRQEIRAEFE